MTQDQENTIKLLQAEVRRLHRIIREKDAVITELNRDMAGTLAQLQNAEVLNG